MRPQALLWLAALAASASASALETRCGSVVLTSLKCPEACGRNALCTNGVQTSGASSCESATQCVQTASVPSAWTIDLTQHPDVAQIQNVTYPEDTRSVVLRGDARANATLDATVFATPVAVTNFTVSGIYVSPALLTTKGLKWQHVTLENVGFETLPQTLSGLPLHTLNLAQNNLHSLNVEIPSLEVLNLTENPLTTIPVSIFRLQSLSTLSLRRCNLTNVVLTPTQLEFLQCLHTLDADFAVTMCPEGSISTVISTTSAVCVRTPSAIDVSVMSTSGSSNKTVVIVVSVVGLVVVLVLLFCCWFCYSRKRSKDEADFSYGTDPVFYKGNEGRAHQSRGMAAYDDVFLADDKTFAGSDAWRDPLLLECRMPHVEVTLSSVLSTNELCEVWRGELATRAVVVKRLSSETPSLQHANTFATTTRNVLAALNATGIKKHPNVVEIIGASWTTMRTFSVVMPFMEGGDLRSLLDADEAASLTWAETKCELAVNVAEALVFVQAQEKTLSPSACLVTSGNVLLNADGKAQLSFVQFAMDLPMMHSTTSTAPRYVAPEVLTGEKPTASAFIYSFGVLLAELDTLQRPFDDVMNPDGSKSPQVVILSRITKGELQPTVSDECPESITALVDSCLSFEPSARPTAEHVAYTLRRIWKEEL